MKRTDRAVSFVLVLAMLFVLSAAPIYGLSGVNAGNEGLIQRITGISIDMETADGPYLVVSGVVSTEGAIYSEPNYHEILVELYSVEDDFLLATGNADIADPDSSEFTVLNCSMAEGGLARGEYYILVSDQMYPPYGVTQDSYRVNFSVGDNNDIIADPEDPWDVVRGPYQLSASPAAVSLEDYTYGETAAGSCEVAVQNSGWETLRGVSLSISGTGITASPVDAAAEMASGQTALYEVTQLSGLTPGAYHVDLHWNADEIATIPALVVPVIFTVNKATQGAVEGLAAEAAATKGGLGKITGLTTTAAYEIYDGENYTTWTALSIEEDGSAWISPGAYEIRLAGNAFYEPGAVGDLVEVPDFYGFDDFTIEDMRAGVPTSYDVTQHVGGGSGTKTYSVLSGALPKDLELTTAGSITGTAVVVTSAVFTAALQVTDEEGATRSAVMTINGIAKGDQATPEAISGAATDAVIAITNWSSRSQAYAISTDSALDLAGVTGWTTFAAVDDAKFEGLARNTQYYIYTYLPETKLLNPSPLVSTGIKTARTSLASVSISGSGIVGEAVTALVSPAGATVKFQWLDESGRDIDGATGASFTPGDAYRGKMIRVQAEGIDDFAETVSSPAFLVGGTKVELAVDTYNPGLPIQAVLTAQDGSVSFSAVSTTAGSVGKALQEIRIERVSPGKKYDLLLQKPGHTDLTINNVEVKTSDVAITLTDAMKMYSGDFNGDNSIRLEDRALLLQSKYFGKAVSSFTGEEAQRAAMLDLDGDGYIKLSDLMILMAQENFGKDAVAIDHTGN